MDFFKYKIYPMDKDKYPCIKRWERTEKRISEYANWLADEFTKVNVENPKPWQIMRKKELQKHAAFVDDIITGHQQALQMLVDMQDMIMQNAKEIETLTALHDN